MVNVVLYRHLSATTGHAFLDSNGYIMPRDEEGPLFAESIIACCGISKCVKKEETRWRRASDQRPVTTAPQTQTAHHMSEKEGER